MKNKYPNRLGDVMTEQGMGPTALAKLVETSKQNIQRWRDGERKLPIDMAEKLAVHLLVKPEALLFDQDEAVYTVGVFGRISAGGTIESWTEQLPEAQPLDEIEVDVPIPRDAFALEVVGESMWPRYDPGDIVICYRQAQDPIPLVGWEAVVATTEGNRYLKRLLRGSEDGLYTLESHNARPIRDVQIAWASEVRHVVRASRWRRLDPKARRRELRKVATA